MLLLIDTYTVHIRINQLQIDKDIGIKSLLWIVLS